MAKYIKPLKSIYVSVGGGDVSVNDEPRNKQATVALDEFLAERTMVMDVKARGATYYVPFHSVKMVESAVIPTEIETSDPYGCKDGGGSSSDKVCDGTACNMQVSE